jgi:hypothetical protein
VCQCKEGYGGEECNESDDGKKQKSEMIKVASINH